MLTRIATVAAVATIGFSAYICLPPTTANAAAPRAVANMKVKEASKLRRPPGIRAFRQRAPGAQNGRDLGRYNRMFEMYSR